MQEERQGMTRKKMSETDGQMHFNQLALAFSSISRELCKQGLLVNIVPRVTFGGETEEQGSNEINTRELLMRVNQTQAWEPQAFGVALEYSFLCFVYLSSEREKRTV